MKRLSQTCPVKARYSNHMDTGSAVISEKDERGRNLMGGLSSSDWISIAGLMVSLLGFTITIFGVRKTKNAALKAQEAVDEVKRSLNRDAVIESFSSAVLAMDEIKRLHRANAWHSMPDLYSSLRKHMTLITVAHDGLTDEQKNLLQGAIAQFRELERKVELYLTGKTAELNSAKFNNIVSDQLDKLDLILNFIKTDRG